MVIDNDAAKTAAYGFTFVSEGAKPLDECFRELGVDVPEGASFRLTSPGSWMGAASVTSRGGWNRD